MKGRNSGFTLIEVLAAIVIIAIALGVLLASFGKAMKNYLKAERVKVAAFLAESKLSEIYKDEFPLFQNEEGTFSEPYQDYNFKIEYIPVTLPDYELYEEETALRMAKTQEEEIPTLALMRLDVYYEDTLLLSLATYISRKREPTMEEREAIQ